MCISQTGSGSNEVSFIIYSPEGVIQRFEERAHAVDSVGVAEYIRALVTTNAIAEYLPDEKSGKPASLPSLVLTSSVICISLIA